MPEDCRDSTTGVHHRFDRFIKLCTKNKTRNTVRDIESKCRHINETPMESVEEILDYWDRYPLEKEKMHEETLLTEELSLEMKETLQILPKRIRTVIILAIIHEKTTREISELLNIHHSTVWKYKSMGIRILREHLTESGNVRQEREKGKRLF